jgi:signal transduction histidine kinase
MDQAMGLPMRERERAKMEMLGRFATGIAHDFNTILHGIAGYAELLVMDTPDGSAERRYAQNVLNAAERATMLVEQILAYSRSERDKPSVVDLCSVAGEVMELFRGTLPRGIELQSRLPSQPLHVAARATQVHQVLMNLCTNAAHAIGERGTIRVTVELASNGGAMLEVTDTGCGMDAATAGRIFEPFFTTKEAGKGTGLGLSLVQAIVSELGGSIDVATKVGIGTTFTVWLPAAANSQPSRLANHSSPRRNHARQRCEQS